jgi:hypothetical protein
MARPADVVVAVIGAVVRRNELRDLSQVERENLIQEKLSLNLRRGRGSGVSAQEELGMIPTKKYHCPHGALQPGLV